MTSPALPAGLKAALDAKLHGLPRGDAAARSAVISRTYRDGGGSAGIRAEADALAYALARMPATYAAVTACLNIATTWEDLEAVWKLILRTAAQDS